MRDWELIADMILQIVQDAKEEDKNHLATLIEGYAEKYPNSFAELRGGKVVAALSLLWDSLVEGSDARPGVRSV